MGLAGVKTSESSHDLAGSRVERPDAGSGDQQKEKSEPHRHVGSRFVQHAPPAVRVDLRKRETPEAVVEQDRDLRGQNCDGDVDQQRNRRETSRQTDDDQYPADDLDASDEWSEQLRPDESDACETADAELRRIQELL